MFDKYFPAVFSAVISITSIFISYYLGSIQSRKTYKKEVKLKTYKTFYVPYIQALYKGFAWQYPAKEHSQTLVLHYLDLITKNLYLIDEQIIELYPEYYQSALNMLEYFQGNGHEDAPIEYEKCFNKITSLILLVGTQLANDLNLPQLGLPLFYFFSNQKKK